MQIQLAFRHVEAELDPKVRELRNTQFTAYETGSQDGETQFKSRRGAKANDKQEQEQAERIRKEQEREKHF